MRVKCQIMTKRFRQAKLNNKLYVSEKGCMVVRQHGGIRITNTNLTKANLLLCSLQLN